MKHQVSTTFKVISYLVMKIDGTKNQINGNCTSYLCRIVKLKNVIEIQLLHNRYAPGAWNKVWYTWQTDGDPAGDPLRAIL